MNKANREYLELLQEHDLQKEFKCLNALQETAWKIHQPVLEVMRWAWDNDLEIGGLPSKYDLPLDPYPFTLKPAEITDKDELAKLNEWKARRSAVYTHNARSISKRLQIERTISLAEDYVKYEKIYMVWTNDFRGRKYTMESFLSPQVADYGKALLTFSEGMPIETVDDADWLAIHGANLFGVDKVSLTDRQLWVYMNEDKIRACAEDPYENTWWHEADKPWQALAWIFEWYGYMQEGIGFVTHLPCAADGTCNGLQHLGAIGLDARGGAAVNLVPASKPQDIYTDVAKATIEKLEEDLKQGNGNTELIKKLLEFGIDRKVTKRSVMIVPYSGTRMACREYIQEALEEGVAKGKPSPGDDLFPASTLLSGYVWDAIQDVIVSASLVMNYLKTVGAHCAKQGLPLRWVTPTGFLVQQAYNDVKTRRLKTHINGSIVQLKHHKAIDDTIDKNRTRNGASPNFIHSLDAAALTLTINECVDHGITDFAMVHDSYGTHSPNMHKMSRILREQFVAMYTENDVLMQLKNYVESYTEGELPMPPEKGTLDLANVLKSDYFFA